MLTEIYKAMIVLHTYKKNPKITRREMSEILTNRENVDESEDVFTEDEISEVKDFLKKSIPTAYYKAFPEERL